LREISVVTNHVGLHLPIERASSIDDVVGVREVERSRQAVQLIDLARALSIAWLPAIDEALEYLLTTALGAEWPQRRAVGRRQSSVTARKTVPRTAGTDS